MKTGKAIAGIGALGAACLVLLLTGCDERDPEPAAGEERTAAVTVWGDRFEIFLEHRFLVAGKPARLITHVSDLTTGLPRREGALVFVLQREGGSALEHTEAAPARAGIYIPELVFPEAGDWTVTLRIPLEGAVHEVPLPSFVVFPSASAAEAAPDAQEFDGITFLKEQQWKIRCLVAPSARRTLNERLVTTGAVLAHPSHVAQVTPPLAGRILPSGDGALPMLGDRVEAGQALALVQPPFSEFAGRIVEARAEVTRAEATLAVATRHLERTRTLHGRQARSDRDLEEAEAAERSARAGQEAARSLAALYDQAGATFQAGGAGEGGSLPAIALRSPIAGIVTQVAAAHGEYVTPERTVFRVLDTSRVLIEARVPEGEIHRVGDAPGASYETLEERGRYVPVTGPDGAGRLVLVDREIDPSTRTLRVVYEMPNPLGGLLAGMALHIHVETSRAEEAIALPESALVEEEGRPVAFVEVSGETFQKRDLELGIRDGGWVQVSSGIGEGEKVVVRGAYAVRLASVSTSIPAHGHAH
ncbi:MAG: efflux RND transporter periplasmic adaptor subunit [Planctomycetes bacterium]|nr:efflux RND transporter periplasmic adaptor subunit [Planctomycetota bacterium]